MIGPPARFGAGAGAACAGAGDAPGVKPTLQDLHRSGLIDHRPLLAAANSAIGEHPGGRDGSEPLVGQPDRDAITEPAGKGAGIAGCRTRRRTLPPGQCARKPHHHLNHLVLSHHRRQLVEVLASRAVAAQRNQRRREDPSGIRQRHANTYLADVHTEAAAPGTWLRSAHPPVRPSSSVRRAAIAAGTPAGWVPPP